MNFKRIAIVFIITLAIFASMSVASAGFLEDLFGSQEVSQPFNTTVDGFNFTIPEGFYELENFSASDIVNDDLGQIYNSKIFSSDDNETFILILTVSYDDAEAVYAGSDDVNTTEKTISGKEGHLSNENGTSTFTYLENGKGIVISAANETIISKVIPE